MKKREKMLGRVSRAWIHMRFSLKRSGKTRDRRERDVPRSREKKKLHRKTYYLFFGGELAAVVTSEKRGKVFKSKKGNRCFPTRGKRSSGKNQKKRHPLTDRESLNQGEGGGG